MSPYLSSSRKERTLMITDPSSLPLASGAISLTRINQDANTSQWRFQNATHRYIMNARHSTVRDKKSLLMFDRHNVEVRKTTFATATDVEFEELAYFVVQQRNSNVGTDLANALANWLVASANANLVKILNWEV